MNNNWSIHIIPLLLLMYLGIISCGGNHKSLKNVKADGGINDDVSPIDSTGEGDIETYVHTQYDYTDSLGRGIIIQNGYPRGGGPIFVSDDKSYGHPVFWSRVINKNISPVKLHLDFPADSIKILPNSNAHFNLLLPPDTMSLNNISTYSYGLGGIKEFVRENFYERSELKWTIPPDEDMMFYVILLSHLSDADNGVWRTGLALDGSELWYNLVIDSSHSKAIPCGEVGF